VTSEVIEFQLARQRVGLRPIEDIEPLSPREQEVLALVAAGRTDGEIADQLFISKKTASVHVANIKGKLAATSRVEIAMLAARLGLVEAGAQPPAGEGQAGRGSRSRVICPFKGLASFDVADARFFFGRERLVAELVARLAGSTFVGVVGASGSGKSSVVRAGLVPAVVDGVLPGSDRWAVAIIRPGATPVTELRRGLVAALRRGGVESRDESGLEGLLDALATSARLLIVIDQFEEVFTLCESVEDRSAFIRSLVSLARDPGSRALVVVAVRADFYGRCAEDRDLADLLGASHVLVGQLTAEELARAIELPARAAGLRVEPELTAALVGDVVDEPGALPLLSTTLLDLWQRRDGRTLRLETYERIGRVSGSVSRLAESAIDRLTPDEQVAARAILLRLATSGGGDVVVRRPVPLADLDADRNADVGRALEVLTDSRLVTVDEGTIEIAHEVLLREWPRLRDWLEEDAEGRRLREHLTDAAAEWLRTGEDPAELYRGARLSATLDWAATHDIELNDLERRFIAESRVAGEREVERQRATNRRLRGLLAGAAGLLALAVIAGAFAATQWIRADSEAKRAEAAAAQAQQAADLERQAADRAEIATRDARVGELAALARAALGDDPSVAKLLALSAAQSADSADGLMSLLRETWAADRIVYRYARPAEHALRAPPWIDLDPTGRLIVSSAGFQPPERNDYIEVVDWQTDDVVWSEDLDDDSVVIGPSFFSPDGSRVIAGVGWMPAEGDAVPPDSLGVHIWDFRTGRGTTFPVGRCGAIVTAVTAMNVLVRTLPDDPSGAPTCFDGDPGTLELGVEVLDLRSGRRTLIGRDGQWTDDGALSGDGRFVAFLDESVDPLRSVVVEVATGRRALEFSLGAVAQAFSWPRSLNEDGSLLLYGDRPIAVLDLAQGLGRDGAPQVVATFDAHGGESGYARFAPGGETVYSTGRDATLRHWEARSGMPLDSIRAVGGGRPVAATGGIVLAGPIVIDAGLRGEVAAVPSCPGFVSTTSLDAVGSIAAFSQYCGSDPLVPSFAQVVDIAAGRSLHADDSSEGQSQRISPDGTRFVHQEGPWPRYGGLTISDLRSGGAVRQLDDLCAWNWKDTPRMLDPDCRTFPERPFPIWIWQVEWSPDGTMIAAIDHAGFFDGFVAVWESSSGKLLHTWDPDATPAEPGTGTWIEDVLFSPDSGELIVATTPTDGWGEYHVFSTDTWEIIREARLPRDVEGGDRPGLVAYLPDGSAIVGVGGHVAAPQATSLYWLDPETLELTGARYRNGIHEGSIKSVDMSLDGSLVATGSSDGLARVWDARTGALVHEILVGDTQVQGVAFVTDDHLAVTPAEGNLLVYTIEPGELLANVRESLTRSFTDVECSRYEIDPCPTLEELRGG
jgi:DNA-binding CsgD family transcriptional regulator/WD40 repeat protein